VILMRVLTKMSGQTAHQISIQAAKMAASESLGGSLNAAPEISEIGVARRARTSLFQRADHNHGAG
jgi:hypothetical protein